MSKVVIEDWTHFNAAVRRRAEAVTPPGGVLTGSPPAPPPPAGTARGADVLPIRPDVPMPVRKPPVGQAIRPPALPATPLDGRSSWLVALIALAVVVGLFLWVLVYAYHQSQPPTSAAADPVAERPVVASAGTEAVVTNYTTFNRVEYRGGVVVTGWNFERNGDPRPSNEYCYFEAQNAGGRRLSFQIETRPGAGRLPMPDEMGKRFGAEGWAEAATKCYWHGEKVGTGPARQT